MLYKPDTVLIIHAQHSPTFYILHATDSKERKKIKKENKHEHHSRDQNEHVAIFIILILSVGQTLPQFISSQMMKSNNIYTYKSKFCSIPQATSSAGFLNSSPVHFQFSVLHQIYTVKVERYLLKIGQIIKEQATESMYYIILSFFKCIIYLLNRLLRF